MKKSILLFYIFFLTAIFFFFEGCSNKILNANSTWLENSIRIDGLITDWEEIPVISTGDDNSFNFKLFNDNDYLYTVFYSRNSKLGRQIKMMGAKLWVDSTGGKNKETGLFFRGGPEMRDSTLPERQFEGKKMGFTGGDHPMGRDKFAVINDEGDVNFISKDGSNGPAIEYGVVNGALIYELKMPLRVKGLENFAIGVNPGDEISICLELQGEKNEGMGRQRPQGGPPGGINMINEEIRGRGVPPGGRPPDKSQKKEIWIKIHLAPK